MTLLTICQSAASQLGLKQPTAIVGSSDLTALKLLRFAQQAGKELSRYHDWQNLIVQKSFTSLAQVAQTNSLPSADYDRMAYNPEIWNTSLNLRYRGPTPQRVWRQLQSGGVSGGVVGWWRILANTLNIYPAPTAGQTIQYEYVSKLWCESSAGTDQAQWTADTDVALISEDLFILEIVWRYRHSRGYAQYAEDMETCEREKEKAASRDRGSGRIRPASRRDRDWPPDPIWTGTITN